MLRRRRNKENGGRVAQWAAQGETEEKTTKISLRELLNGEGNTHTKKYYLYDTQSLK